MTTREHMERTLANLERSKASLDSGTWIRVEHDPPPIPTRECDWHAWIDGDEEWGSFHGPDRYSVLMQIADALAERYYSQPATTGCAQCGAVKQVKE